MQIKSLEIQGFKSFPDKVKLTFGRGITAVVGPNGSGKSNIVDAVRWVFGEQSSKTLRGSKMEDVIFGGTAIRKPQGSASVNLVLDNSDRMLNVDSDEISITRKLYRSGESEYRLGGASVRLKDIYELFMDTGLGRDGYSVIGQGRIAEIISSKSSERREVFEEAAGISKFRYRRGEAQRRLAAAEENMLRLRDILAELSDRVGPLKQEAEKAQEFLALAGEKRTLEISVWLADIDRFSAQYAGMQDKFLAAKGEYEDLTQEGDALEEQVNLLYTQMQDYAAAADGLRRKLREWENTAAEIRSAQAVNENDIAHHRESIAALQRELAEGEKNASEAEQGLAAAGERLAELNAGLEQTRQEQQQLQEQLRACAAEVEQQDAAIAQQKLHRAAIYKGIDDARFSGAASESLLEETRRRLKEIQDAAAQREEVYEDYRQELQVCSDLIAAARQRGAELENTRKGYQLRWQGRQARQQELAERIAGILTDAAQKRQRANILEGMEKSLEGYTFSVKHILQSSAKGALQGVHGTVSQLITAPPEYGTAIEIALGAALQNLVVEDENCAKQCIRLLDRERKGRATFLPLTAVRGRRMDDRELAGLDGYIGIASTLVQAGEQYGGIVEHLLGRIAIAENLDCAVNMARHCGYRFRVVTLDGQVINTGGAMTGGYTAKSSGLLGRRREIEQLEAAAAQAEQKAGETQRLLDSQAAELKAVEEEIRGIDAQVRVLADDLIRAESEQKRLELALNSAAEAKAKETAEQQSLAGRLEQLACESSSAREVIAALTAELEEQNAAIEAEQQRRQATDSRSRELERQAAGLEMKLLEQQKDSAAAAAEQQRLLAVRQGGAARMEEIAQRMADLEQDMWEKQEELEAGRMRLDTIAEETAAAGERIQGADQARQLCEGKTSELRARIRELTGRREGFAREVARLDERLAAIGLDRDQVIAKLWDEYEITPSVARRDTPPLQDPAGASRRLNSIKNRIRALGNVHVGAVEEYAEVSGRQQFLSAQLADVERSQRELARLIEELTAQMRELFLQSFAEINRHFGRIFADLFGGGRAALHLEDPADPLNCGIEISVQPPGKVIKNLAALSGGEQVFVAIAIYFAILSVNPSPFVVLDEIEAALDDVNVAKYAKYLRSMAGSTQFIAITHRRGTMEEADVLYGVTMQEEGVSKLIELRIGELEQQLGVK